MPPSAACDATRRTSPPAGLWPPGGPKTSRFPSLLRTRWSLEWIGCVENLVIAQLQHIAEQFEQCTLVVDPTLPQLPASTPAQLGHGRLRSRSLAVLGDDLASVSLPSEILSCIPMNGRVVTGSRAANPLKPPPGWRHAATPSIPEPSDPASDRNRPQEQRMETRPLTRPLLQTPVPPRRQNLRPRQPAEMAARQAHRSSDRAQRHRVQRTVGRCRWVIERTMSWLSGYRRLSPRYERHPRNYLAFLGLAAT